MDREATYGGVDPEIFDMIARDVADEEESTEWGKFARPLRQLYSPSINAQEADELGQILMDLEAAREQP